MKPFRWLASSSLVAVALGIARPLTAQRPVTIDSSYDRFADETTLRFDRLTFGDSIPMGYGIYTPKLSLLITATAPGKAVAARGDSVQIRFVGMTMIATNGRPLWQFDDNRQLSVLLDDSLRLTVPAFAYDSTRLPGSPNAAENMRAMVPLAWVAEIASAHKAEARLGTMEFAITDPQRTALREYVDRLRGHAGK